LVLHVGLLVGRVAVAPILIHASSATVTLAASAAMAITTLLALRTKKASLAGLLVFFAGISMAPVFPTTLAIVGDAFPRMTGTAIGFVITCGWVELAVSSRIIGSIAENDPLRLKKALLVIPASACLMVRLNPAILRAL
jgi:fucose permease